MTIQNRLPLALDYGDDGSPSGLAEYSISSVDLADVATLAQGAYPQPFQVLAWSAIGDGSFLYAPSTIDLGTGGGGGGGNFETCESLTGCSITKLSDVCTDSAVAGEVLAYNAVTGKYCPSTLNYANNPTGGTNGDIVIKGAGGIVYSPPGTVAASLKTAGGYAVVSAANAFTSTNTFTGGQSFTGTTTFAARPSTGGVNYTIATDLDAYVTEAEYDASSEAFTTTATFYTTTATLLEKPATGSGGELLLYSAGNNTATTGVAAFITDQTIVKTSDLAAYATNTNLAATALIARAALPSGAAGDNEIYYKNGSNPDGLATTTQSRTFLGTDTKLSRISDVSFEAALATGDTLRYNEDDSEWRNYPAAANFLVLGNQSVAPNYATASGSYTVSNVVTVPPGSTGKGDTTVDSFIIFSGTDASSTEYVGTRWGANWVEGPQNIETTNGNYFAYVSATPTGDAPGLSGVAAVALNANALEFIENGSATNVSANSVTISDLNVTRVGQMNPTTYIQEGDWLTPGAAANGFGSSQTGTGAGFGQCFDNDVMHPDKGTFGVYEIRSGSDAYGRAFLTTFNNAIAVSSCAISFTSRIAPSGLWVAGVNDGKMSFGIRNGTSNAEPTYAMEFQYGQGTGGGGSTWSAVVVDNSNSTVSDTGIAASAQEFQVLQVSCNENWQNVDFYVDGTLKAQFNIADHHIPDSRYNRLGAAWSINNANIFSSSNQNGGNEIFLDWHQLRMTHNNTTRGRDLIK